MVSAFSSRIASQGVIEAYFKIGQLRLELSRTLGRHDRRLHHHHHSPSASDNLPRSFDPRSAAAVNLCQSFLRSADAPHFITAANPPRPSILPTSGRASSPIRPICDYHNDRQRRPRTTLIGNDLRYPGQMSVGIGPHESRYMLTVNRQNTQPPA